MVLELFVETPELVGYFPTLKQAVMNVHRRWLSSHRGGVRKNDGTGYWKSAPTAEQLAAHRAREDDEKRLSEP